MSLSYGRLLTRPDSICLSLVSLIILNESTSQTWHIGAMDLKDTVTALAGQNVGVSTSFLNFSGSSLNSQF